MVMEKSEPDFQKLAARQVFADGRRVGYIGQIQAAGWHEHATEAWLFGLDGPFHITTADGSRQYCRSAVVPTGLLHELRIEMGRFVVIYLDPVLDQPGLSGFGVHPRIPHPREGEFLAMLAMLAEGQMQPADFWDTVDGCLKGRRMIDQRLCAVVSMIERRVDLNMGVEVLAESVNLSPSRLIHLAREELGVSLRRYRMFERMRRSVLDIHAGKSLTATALDMGFATPSHFSASFRNMFGVSPSSALLQKRNGD